MTHPDTLQIDRAVEPEWGPQQAYAEGRSAYENSMLPNTTSAVRFNELSASEQAFWVAHAAFRAALQPQDAVTTSGPPERDNSKPAEQQGVFRKFNVQRTDGSDQPGGKHHGCEYFVLDVAHDQHAKPALEAYAVACATTHPQLSADMRERYGLQAQADTSVLQAAPWPPQAAAEPVAYCVYFPTEQRQEYCQDLDELCEDLTNLEHEITPLYTSPPATQAALTAASDCRTCQHLSEAWGVCEARPKCVGGEQYVYFPEKQLWDKTPRNDGQAAHQEMREALYAEFNSAVGRQHD